MLLCCHIQHNYGASMIAVCNIVPLWQSFFITWFPVAVCVCVLAGQGRKAICLVVSSAASGDEWDQQGLVQPICAQPKPSLDFRIWRVEIYTFHSAKTCREYGIWASSATYNVSLNRNFQVLFWVFAAKSLCRYFLILSAHTWGTGWFSFLFRQIAMCYWALTKSASGYSY